MANIDPPWGWPHCPDEGERHGFLAQPYAPGITEYDGIYKLAEQRITPIAPYFFPVLTHEEHRNWVRIARVPGTPNGKPKPKTFAYGSWREYRNEAPLSMRIDKCTGAISEMMFDRDKVR